MSIFVGREEESRALVESLEAARAGAGTLVLVSGEPGIGKTRLAEELTRRAQADGFLVAWGRTWEGEGTPAFYPWIQIMRRLAPSLGPLFHAMRDEYPELDLLLGTRRATPTADASGDPIERRFRSFDAVAELLRVASIDAPLLLVLDDLHTADASTLDLLWFVARSARSSARVLLVGTMRDTPSTSRPLLAKIASEAMAIPLGRLPRDAVASWVARAAPEMSENVDRVVSVSEGNPLFVGELIASAKKQPTNRWSSMSELPLGVREAIRAHIATLSDHARDVVARASILGREIAATALPAGSTSALEEAIHAGIVTVVGDGEEGRYRFAHILIRDELDASLSADKRSELHREAAAAERDPTRAAQHWLEGARPEDAPVLAATVLKAMRDANARFAFEDAAMLGERALKKTTFAAREACELGIAIGEAWSLAGRLPAARAAARSAFEQARALGDATLLARAALAHATEIVVGDRDHAAVELLRAAVDALPAEDSLMRARVLARYANALLPAPPHEHSTALALGEQAIAMARRLGDEETLFTVLAYTRRTPSETDPPSTRFALNAETIALAQKLGRVPEIASLFAWQVAACIELGDLDAAHREADAMEAALSSYTQPVYRYQLPLVRAMLADVEGRFAEADALSHDVLRFCEEHALLPGMILAVVQRAGFGYTRGHDAGWVELEPKVLPILDNPLFKIYRAMFDAPCGRVDRVRESLALTTDIPIETLPDGAGLAAVVAMSGIAEQAPRFYEALEREERMKGPWQFGPGRITSVGPRALILGRLALLMGKKDEAIRHLDRALAHCERLRSPPYIAQCRAELAKARGSVHPRAISQRPPASGMLTLLREGETWVLRRDHKRVVLKDAKGLAYLEALIAAPRREIHVLELVGHNDEGDAGPVLDERAKRAYRERAHALREELEEATRNSDAGRAERARNELDALAHELARAVGISGRDRRAVSPSERARINVQRRIRDVVGRIRTLDAELAEHVQLSVRTGMFCVYLPLSDG